MCNKPNLGIGPFTLGSMISSTTITGNLIFLVLILAFLSVPSWDFFKWIIHNTSYTHYHMCITRVIRFISFQILSLWQLSLPSWHDIHDNGYLPGVLPGMSFLFNLLPLKLPLIL